MKTLLTNLIMAGALMGSACYAIYNFCVFLAPSVR